MKITVRSTRLANLKTPMLAVPVFGSGWREPTLAALDELLGGRLRKLAREEGFKGKPGQTFSLAGSDELSARRVVLIGLGEWDDHPAGQLRTFAAQAGRQARSRGLKRVALAVPVHRSLEPARAVRWLTEGVLSGTYRFERWLTGDRRPEPEPGACVLVLPREASSPALKATAELRQAVERGEATSRGLALARDLVNEPPNELNPEAFALRARAVADEHGLECVILGPEEIRQRGLGLLQAVSLGSTSPPRFIHLIHRPRSETSQGRIALVGKGITFDSGGLSIKNAKGMVEMKCDMAGAALVLGTLQAAAELDLPYEFHGLIPATENMPGGRAYRPGDVFRSMSGKTVEVLNTDAEGRLILADALTYARELEPDLIIDFATLTGACMVALGHLRAGVFSDHDTWADRYLSAARKMGEDFWRLPLAPELREQLKSDIADIKNIGGSWGGAITAALFLKEFAEDTPWIHVDVAGPVFIEKAHRFYPKGGTGFGVLTALELFGG